MAPRSAYTRPEVAAILVVTERTLVRWHQEGKHFHPWRDPSDPTGRRWLYDKKEVDNFARRRKRRGSGSYRVGIDRGDPDPSAPPTEANAPDSLRTRIDKLLREIGKVAGADRPTRGEPDMPPSKPPPAAPSPTPVRREPDATDRELERWTRKVDEEKRRWEETHGARPTDDAADEANDDEQDDDDDAEPSSRRTG